MIILLYGRCWLEVLGGIEKEDAGLGPTLFPLRLDD